MIIQRILVEYHQTTIITTRGVYEKDVFRDNFIIKLSIG